ncbi:RNA polymerase sigma factor [Spirosoma daeguense]
MAQPTHVKKHTHIIDNTDPFEALYNQYVNKVFQKCLTMVKDPESAQDYTQDIFMKVFSKMDQFEQKSSLSTWLFSITHNYCLDQIRISRRKSTESLTYEMADSVQETVSGRPTDEELTMLNNVMAQLPLEEATLLRLKYEQNLSIAELSDSYQISQSAVKMRLKRSREKLVSLYAQKYERYA